MKLLRRLADKIKRAFTGGEPAVDGAPAPRRPHGKEQEAVSDLGTFIDTHPWVTFGAFIIALNFAGSIGKLIRIRIGTEKQP